MTAMPDPAALAAAALALRRSHPQAPALDVLDVVLQGAHITLADLGDDAHPGAPFGQILAEAFDPGMPAADWAAWTAPTADPVLRSTLLDLWELEVLPRFAARYGLAQA